MYLTYDEYIEYGGTLDETAFNQYEFKCRKLIDNLTVKRVAAMATVPEAVKRCMMALIYQEQIYEDNVKVILSGDTSGSTGRLVSSVSTDGYQESYASGSGDPGSYIMTIRGSVDTTEANTIKSYLAYERDDNNTLLLYRGVF